MNNSNTYYQVEIHVFEDQIDIAKHVMNWDAALSEQFDYKGFGIWCSAAAFEAGFDEDSAQELKEFAEDRLKENRISSFYVEIEETNE